MLADRVSNPPLTYQLGALPIVLPGPVFMEKYGYLSLNYPCYPFLPGALSNVGSKLIFLYEEIWEIIP